MKKLLVHISLVLPLLLISMLGFSYANATSKLTCTLTNGITNDGKPIAQTDKFHTTTASIDLVCSASGIKPGQSVTAKWIAKKVEHVTTPDYQIRSFTLTIPNRAEFKKQSFTLRFSLSKPTKGWPTGKYSVNLFVDEESKPIDIYRFSVER